MTEDDIKDLLLGCVQIHCTGHRPFWNCKSYKPAIFAIFQQSLQVAPLHGDFFVQFLINNTPAIEKKDYDTIHSICSAWSEWLYCYQELALDQ